ncbi:uncharacterized protein LOC105638926 isoform X2 [Jatropha curcas]|uniref:uncharacterized protein LOC105638926 isoform X2 n=1 Tax=Jatropha curcas TaxID=180498 RepID=UPI0005FBD251|nr:uncharacterized protein LOC105638926 isoform X2 [Jatropha curcas]
MDKPSEGEGTAMVDSADAEIQQRGSSRVGRRLVQSTLVPHKSPAIESKDEQKDYKDCNGDSKNGDDEEFCGSQGKKKGTRKRKETPQTKTPKARKRAKGNSSVEATPEKNATPKKSKVNGTPRKKATPKNGTPRKKATPKKNGANNGKSATHLVENGNVLPQIPNLRLEAKMIAEENSRIFAGKQIHPFFLSRRMGMGSVEKTIQRKPKSVTMGPIHVFEKEQDEAVTIDWSYWEFFEKSLANSNCTLEGSSSIFECTVKSCFDQVSSVLHPSDSSLLHNNMSLHGRPFEQEFLQQASATAMSSDVQDYQVDDADLLSGRVRKSDGEQQSNILVERMSSHLGCTSQPDNRLWTDKYKPQKAVEICGNNDSVKFLNEWLYNWHQRGRQTNKASIVNEEFDKKDPDYNCSQHDSDLENSSEDAGLKNVLLITGPVGSGKSAAIYACAKEQGFRVVEANTSECRNGATLKERFGASQSQSTLDSQLLQWSQESLLEVQSMDIMKSPAVPANDKMVQEPDSEVIEVIPISDEDISREATETSEKFACGQGTLKPLILFEDVDIIFSEDHGFINAIQQIANNVKGPVILTSNSDKPVLPNSMDRITVCFKLPLEEELLQHLCLVCSSENTNIQPNLVEELIEFCQRDIRKTIMHLQFWCQGENFRKGSEAQKLSSLMPFNLEAGYQILPKMIPWDFPSQLSQLVVKEITSALNMMDENSVFNGAIEEKYDDKDRQNNLKKPIYGSDSLEAKKKTMLSKNCSDHDCIDFIPLFDTESNFFDSSSSPFPFSQRNSRRKLMVMSSDSEGDVDRGATSPDKNISNELFIEVDGECPSHCPSMQKEFSPSTELNLYSGAEKLVENNYQRSETAIDLNVKGTCLSVDLSCVPESSFVPETEVNDGTELLLGRLCDRVGQEAEILEEASVSNEFRQNVLPVEVYNYDESMPNLHKDSDLLGGTCDVTVVLSQEGLEDSQSELMETITSEHQLMDECSRINFSRKFKQHEKWRSSAAIYTVQESWRKLRDRCANLRHFAAAEKYSSGIVKLACGMSNLISEAELLHIKCQSMDSLGLPIVFSEESDAFSRYNEQLQMASTILQHGFCLYAKDIATAGLNMGYDSKVDLAWEVSSTPCEMKVNSLFGQNSKALNIGLGAEMSQPENGILPNSEWKSIVQSVVPSRAYMTIKGDALYEYLSSLSHISRSEASRLSEDANKNKRRRGRAARNYLNTLSPEEISLLAQSPIYMGRFHHN